jgi:hypothetical protein
MAIVVLQYRVSDVEAWKTVFGERQEIRRQSGATRHWVYRSLDDPNALVVNIDFSDADRARAFAMGSDLREAMTRAGVEGSPTVLVTEEFESVTY